MLNGLPFTRLADRWREQAASMRRYGVTGQAEAIEACADELEQAEREYLYESLTLKQASKETGLSYDTIGRMVRTCELPNAGKLGSPRIRRCDLLPNLEAEAPLPVNRAGEPDVAAELLRNGH